MNKNTPKTARPERALFVLCIILIYVVGFFVAYYRGFDGCPVKTADAAIETVAEQGAAHV